MMRSTLLLAAGLCATLSLAMPSVMGAEVPTITISKSDSIAIALNPIGGADGAAIRKVVENDLALSGLFTITEANRAAMLVGGSASGKGLQGLVNDHGGGTILSRSYSGSTRDKAHAFANDIIETLTGKKGMAGSKIAFVSSRTGKKEIYVADYDGHNLRQMTHDGNISVAPALSPNGQLLAYTAYLKGYADIYTINLQSGARQRIVKFPGTNSGAAFSPDGNRIACTISKDGNPELYVLSTSGSGARRLTRTQGVESSPTWSPDGSEIIYCSDDAGSPQLYRISSNGGSGRRLPINYRYCTKPTWSPDGRRVAFNIREGGVFRIALHDLSSGSTRVVSDGGDARDPIWGPDSRHLLFTQGGNLFMLDIQNGKKTRIVDNVSSISEPAWSR